MYFKNFPNMIYDFNIGGKDTALYLKDITRNIRFRRDILTNITIYDEYDIVDNETPEHIAEKLYGNPNYHWIIMLVNEKYDYLNDFPLSYYDLEKHITTSYGDTAYHIHHYEDSIGYIVDSTSAGASSITNYQYEQLLNESKRRIKVVPKGIIEQIVTEFKKIL
jgi:hypothetical protein